MSSGPARTHTHWLSCGCSFPLPVALQPGREVLCAPHGPVTVTRVDWADAS